MKPPRQKRKDTSSATITQTLGLILACSALLGGLTVLGDQPAWWSTRGAVLAPQIVTNSGVVTTNYVPNDYAAVTQGQLKQFTARAVDELNADLPGGARTNLNGMISNWVSDYATNGYGATNIKPSDYTAMNVGQLKYIGNKVWSQLVAAGYTNAAPSWLAQNTNSDHAVANLGQLKEVFNFDLTLDSDGNGLPDWWEIRYFGHTGNDPNSSLDGNALTLLQDYQQGNDPNNYYSQNGHVIVPSLEILSGNNQSSVEATFAPQPLVVLVTDDSNAPMVGAPVNFSFPSWPSGALANSTGGSTTNSVALNTDTNGKAQVFFQQPASADTTSQINAAISSQSVTFTETTEVRESSLAAPTGITVTPSGPGEMDITWANNAYNATFILLQQSTDGVNWTTTAVLNDPTATSYAAMNLLPDQSYYFRVAAGRN